MRSLSGKKTIAVAGALAASVIAVAGCGSDDDYKNEQRPPAPIVVTAAIGQESVSVSPRDFGAGPISLIVTNQTDDPQTATLETADTSAGSGIRQHTGEISSGDTATLKVDIKTGTYRLGVGTSGIEPAQIVVGEPRPSAQNELLQP